MCYSHEWLFESACMVLFRAHEMMQRVYGETRIPCWKYEILVSCNFRYNAVILQATAAFPPLF